MSFEEFAASLARVQLRTPLVATPEHTRIRHVAEQLADLAVVDRASVAELLVGGRGALSRDVLRVLGLSVGLSHERLKAEITAHLGHGERRQAERVVQFLDEEFNLISEIAEARRRRYGWSDLLVARAGSRQSAGQAVAGGRSVEDAIESVVRELQLPHQLRTRFVGRGNGEAPCDVAIPAGGTDAQIVCAAKGFDSTGSKLTDAVREIQAMADVRKPTQFVYAVVDGIGWHRRAADLHKIYSLLEASEIDGLYTLAMLDCFREDVDAAATQRGIPRLP